MRLRFPPGPEESPDLLARTYALVAAGHEPVVVGQERLQAEPVAALESKSPESSHEDQLAGVGSLLFKAGAVDAVGVVVDDPIEPREGAAHEVERGDVVW